MCLVMFTVIYSLFSPCLKRIMTTFICISFHVYQTCLEYLI